MKSKLFSLLLSLAFLSVFGQVTETDTLNPEMNKNMYDFYMKKSKKQKKASLILLGSGVAAITTGVLIANNSGFFTNEGTAGALLVFTGGLATIASLPVGIVSGSNKKKADTYLEVARVRPIETTVYNAEGISVGLKIKF